MYLENRCVGNRTGGSNPAPSTSTLCNFNHLPAAESWKIAIALKTLPTRRIFEQCSKAHVLDVPVAD